MATNDSPSAPAGSRRARLWAALVFSGCAALLGTAAYLEPDAAGYGTHRQLGFGKCGMLVTTGLPCPTCGMTTAYAYTVRGRLISAFVAQPAGFLLALATIVAAVGSVRVIVTGRFRPRWMPILTPYRLFFGLLIFFVGGWAFKIVYGLLTGALPEHP